MKMFVHPRAIIEEGATIGEKTRIWAFTHICPGAVIGGDCNICDHVFVENDVRIGNRVTIKCGVYLWDGIVLEDDVFVGPNATFTNDKFPRSKQCPGQLLKTCVCRGASIGANATILPGLRIGEKAMIGAGAVVTLNVPRNAIVTGNPAQIVGYMDAVSRASVSPQAPEKKPSCSVRGVTLREFTHVNDLRGNLCVMEWEKDLPFPPQRVFFVHGVPNVRVRGEHAHRKCHQFLVCVKGSVCVVADDGLQREEFLLDSPWLGLYLPPLVWGIQYKYSADAILMVFASHPYDASDYIRNYDEFLNVARS
ncbi:MAG: WxcM-like domain-containing protein [Phycisphaerae bacterium]|nr:WxcM-like domain-containing protein [Phycisphaerae bacterium]